MGAGDASADLEAAAPRIEDEDIVVIVTGWHRRYSDSIDYFGHAPGLSKEAAQWLCAKNVKLVAVDTPQVDHPLATSLGPQRNGPQMKRLPKAYQTATGRDPKPIFPEWNPAHRALLAAGIPTIENVGGEVDALVGKRCTFQAFPWNWPEGDACVVRFVAMLDPAGAYRLEAGAQRLSAAAASKGEQQMATANSTRRPEVLQSQRPLGPRHSAMAVGARHQCADVAIPCARRRLCAPSSKASCTAARTWMRRCM